MLAFGSSLEEDRGLVWSVGRKGAAGGAWVDALGDGRRGARSTKGLGKSTDGARSRPSGDAVQGRCARAAPGRQRVRRRRRRHIDPGAADDFSC